MASESKNGGIGAGSGKAPAKNKNVVRQLLERRPDPSTISAKSMEVAEEALWKEVLFRIHPTLDEEEKRADITQFLQTIITRSFEGIEVFPYGSVPLKTYLGDGDIDLTVICKQELKDSLVDHIYKLLKFEEQNRYAELYTVKETKIIGAEVKLVKCKVNNVSVDISFNQLGGLSALCFLEEFDRLVKKDHLFKLSVLLIKAWCHYEGHILGAYHGLLATYALEALVLCIFQLFGSSLRGPLAVLYRFFDYYAKFDWNNWTISLDGPVRTSSLTNGVVPDLGKGRAGLFLSKEDWTSYMDLFAYSSYTTEQDQLIFTASDLNIIDPLKQYNNLGRNIVRANCKRIQSAFKYGARHLGQILLLPRERIRGEIRKFFNCTMTKYEHSGAELRSLPPFLLFEKDVLLTSVEGGYIDELRLDLKGVRLARDVCEPFKATSGNEYFNMVATENSNLLDLTGDYASLVRSYAHGRCTLGFCSTVPGLSTPPLTLAQYREMYWSFMQWNFEATVNSIPNMYSTSFWERSFHPAPVNLIQEPTRKLTTPRPSQKDNTEGNGKAAVEERRIPEKSINLNSEQEFPPLS